MMQRGHNSPVTRVQLGTDEDLSYLHDVKISDKIRESLELQYWSTLQKTLKKGNQLSLPAAYQLDNVNWINTFFDYLASDPDSGNAPVYQAEYLIPDTIIIKQRRAFAWISANDSVIHRREKITDLQPRLLHEGLCQAYKRKGFVLSSSTVLAYLIAAQWNDQRNEWSSTVEYFDVESLRTYLYERLRCDDRSGILQLHIPPPGGSNSVIRAWWTPHCLKIEQRANIHDIDSPHIPLGTRAATFDGSLHLSEIRNIPGQDLRDEIAEQLEWIVEHVSSLLPPTHRIWRGVFYFKMGVDGRLYLLWCSSLQFMAEENHEGATNQRPLTPKCIESSLISAEMVEAGDGKHDTDKGLGPDIGLCPSCARDISVCNVIEYKVRYLSLLRKICPILYVAIEREQDIVQRMRESERSWTEYIESAVLAKHIKYGEAIETKFPRNPSRRRYVSSRSSYNAEHAKKLEAEAEKKAFDTDRHYLRTVIMASVFKKREISQERMREIVLYAATNPSFEGRLVSVCEDCCLSINQSEIEQAKLDLLDCTAPLDQIIRPFSSSQQRPPEEDTIRQESRLSSSSKTRLRTPNLSLEPDMSLVASSELVTKVITASQKRRTERKKVEALQHETEEFIKRNEKHRERLRNAKAQGGGEWIPRASDVETIDEIFASYDADKDGYLFLQEVELCFKEIASAFNKSLSFSSAKAQAEQCLRTCGRSGRDRVNLEEVKDYISSQPEVFGPLLMWKYTFKKYTRKDSEEMGKEGLLRMVKDIMSTLGKQIEEAMARQLAQDLMDAADTDGSNSIDFDEFLQYAWTREDIFGRLLQHRGRGDNDHEAWKMWRERFDIAQHKLTLASSRLIAAEIDDEVEGFRRFLEEEKLHIAEDGSDLRSLSSMAADVGSGTLRNHSLVSLQRMRRKNFSLALRIMSPRTREQAISVMQRGLAAEEATPSEAATGERGGGGGGEGNSGLSDPRMLSESVDVTSTEDDNRPAFQPSSLPSSSLLDAQVDELHRRLEGLQEWSESALEVMEAGAEEEKVKEEEEAAREESESFLPKLKSKKERTKSKAGASRLGKQTLHAARVRGTEERPRSSLEVARREKKLAGHVRSKSSLSQHAAPRPLDEAVRVSGKSNLKLKPLRDIPTLKPFAPSSGDPYRIKFIEVYNPLTSSGILCAAGRMPIKKRKQLPRRTEEERDEAAKPEQVGEEVAAKLEEEKGKENEERVNEQVEEGAKIEAGEASEGILEVSEEE